MKNVTPQGNIFMLMFVVAVTLFSHTQKDAQFRTSPSVLLVMINVISREAFIEEYHSRSR